MNMNRLLVTVLLCLSAPCLSGCGGHDYSDEKFVEDTNNQYDRLIEKVETNPALSEQQREYEIARIENERGSFRSYAGGGQGQDQGQ
ncbi:MAG: hypothetical protein KDA93_27135 [Planctomycetaceae bacterium]|nr:hypothetical protein [Planctomycetaceae bacterium]